MNKKDIEAGLEQLDELFEQVLSAFRYASLGWFDVDLFCEECKKREIAMAIVEEDDRSEVTAYYYAKKDIQAFTRFICETQNLIDKAKTKNERSEFEKLQIQNQIKSEISSAFFFKQDCEESLRQGGDIDRTLRSIFNLACLYQTYKSIDDLSRILSLDRNLSPYELIGKMQKLGNVRRGGQVLGKKDMLYNQAIEEADRLWETPEYKDFNHYKMAKMLVYYSPDNSIVPYSDLSDYSLKERLKKHLKTTNRTEKIFNYTHH